MLCFPLKPTEYLIPHLDEEQGGAHLPDFVQTGAKSQLFFCDGKTALLYIGGEISLSACPEILIKGGIDGGEATAEEQAAVVAAAGEHGGITRRQVLPAGMLSKFPEDGIK